ncbi:MAG: winged helix-turn-helix transcriptional regulator [Armatimonadota bacterium]
MATEVVVVTERERREPMVTLLGQLRRLGYSVSVIPRATFQNINRVPVPQVVLLDVGSRDFQHTGGPGSLQAAWEYVPIILLASAEEATKIHFGPHLHDFITLPASLPELDTRLRFAVWKTQGARGARDQVQVQGLRMNMASCEVYVENRRVELTFKEFELLKFFVSHPRRVFSRPELLEEVWESDYFGGTRTVDVHIRRLRAKLGTRVGNMIQTVRNVGYRFG